MLTMVDDEVLQANPGFARLYATLTTSILNADGSTRHAKQDQAVEQALDEQRLDAHKLHLIQDALATLVPAPPLRDLVVSLTSFLSTPVSPTSAALLLASPPLSRLETHLADLAALVSSSLVSSAAALAPSPSTRHDASPATRHATLVDALATARRDFDRARARVLSETARLVATHARTLCLLVRAVEAKHGVLARGLELAATLVALDAQHAQLDAAQLCRSLEDDVYSPDVVAALDNYSAHLQHVKSRLTQRIDDLNAQMRHHFASVGADGAAEEELRRIAARYTNVTRQLDEATKGIQRRQNG